MPQYYNSQYFHPAFLYESLGNLIIFAALLVIHYLIIKKMICRDNRLTACFGVCVIGYMAAYSILRFFLEFIRIDRTPVFFGLRLPQITSLIIIAASVIFFVLY